jgi:MoxR-like ATPase
MSNIDIASFASKLKENIGVVIKGKEEVVDKLILSFLCGGHILLEDIPGTGKTTLVKALAKSVDCNFTRVQFTPDLLPSDLTGINIFDQKTSEFVFRPGPLFANLVLADEINRATPRTQSALLEAMAEKQVTVDGRTYPMAEPFMIMATENPLESFGTFELPEAQTDRFLMRLSMGYMKREEEMEVIRGEDTSVMVEKLQQRVSAEETAMVKKQLEDIEMNEDVLDYLMRIVEATRTDPGVRTGVSTRGAIALYRAACARAGLNGRQYVLPEDIRALAVCVLAHRLSLSASAGRASQEEIISSLLEKIPVPLEESAFA